MADQPTEPVEPPEGPLGPPMGPVEPPLGPVEPPAPDAGPPPRTRSRRQIYIAIAVFMIAFFAGLIYRHHLSVHKTLPSKGAAPPEPTENVVFADEKQMKNLT